MPALFARRLGCRLARRVVLRTTDTGGIGEAVGDTAMIVPTDSPASITAALDLAVTMPCHEREDMAERARAHALQFDRMRVFDRLLERVSNAVDPTAGSAGLTQRLALW